MSTPVSESLPREASALAPAATPAVNPTGLDHVSGVTEILCCHNCAQALLPGDRFCEACGTVVSPAVSSGTELTTTSPETACGHCGFTEAIPADGFCRQCGLRQAARSQTGRTQTGEIDLSLDVSCAGDSNDHQVQELSPHLAAVSDRGLRRSSNQDAVAIARPPSAVLLSVCDGISSSPQAALAAQTAAASVTNSLVAALSHSEHRNGSGSGSGSASGASDAASLGNNQQLPQQQLQSAILQAQREVSLLSTAANPAPSTTLVCALVDDASSPIALESDPAVRESDDNTTDVARASPCITLAWLGDSRAYWLTASGSSCLLTQDHADEQQRLTHWLGADADFTLAPAQFRQFQPSEPGALLLCSDGLWNYASTAEQLQTLVFPASKGLESDSEIPQESALETTLRLIEFAKQQGGQDNISVALLYL